MHAQHEIGHVAGDEQHQNQARDQAQVPQGHTLKRKWITSPSRTV
jgi:hypothetical protein